MLSFLEYLNEQEIIESSNTKTFKKMLSEIAELFKKEVTLKNGREEEIEYILKQKKVDKGIASFLFYYTSPKAKGRLYNICELSYNRIGSSREDLYAYLWKNFQNDINFGSKVCKESFENTEQKLKAILKKYVVNILSGEAKEDINKNYYNTTISYTHKHDA